MKCVVCKKNFKDGEKVSPVLRYVTNYNRGDFVASQAEEFFHVSHLSEILKPSEPKGPSELVLQARIDSRLRHQGNPLSCRLCGHGLGEHNVVEGCRHCRCLGTPSEATPRTDADMDAVPISHSQRRENF